MRPPADILVCFAVKEEAWPFSAKGALLPSMQVLVTGMGRGNALSAVRTVFDSGLPKLVVTAGFAGGLNPALKFQTVLFAADPGAGDLPAALTAVGATAARFCCAERVVTTTAEKQRLWSQTGADAVEMESQFIRDLCHQNGVPSVTVRVILDTATEDLPIDFSAVMTPDMRLDKRKLAFTLARSPRAIAALFGLQKRTRSAALKLAETLLQALAKARPAT